jgi:hypothetical protein
MVWGLVVHHALFPDRELRGVQYVIPHDGRINAIGWILPSDNGNGVAHPEADLSLRFIPGAELAQVAQVIAYGCRREILSLAQSVLRGQRLKAYGRERWMCSSLYVPLCFWLGSKTLVEKRATKLPCIFLHMYGSRNPWLCLAYPTISGNVEPMTTIERIAYPSFKRHFMTKELEESCIPTPPVSRVAQTNVLRWQRMLGVKECDYSHFLAVYWTHKKLQQSASYTLKN